MEIWIVMYDTEICGAFKTKEEAYNYIVEDYTATNAPRKEDNPYYEEMKREFDENLYELKYEYDNYANFGCCDHWRAESTTLN